MIPKPLIDGILKRNFAPKLSPIEAPALSVFTFQAIISLPSGVELGERL